MIPLWTPLTAPCRTGWLLASIRGMALRVVAHVQERLVRLLRDRDAVEERAGSGALLVERQVAGRAAVRIARGVGAALRDAREQGLSRERPVDAARAMEAVSGDSAHFSDFCTFLDA